MRTNPTPNPNPNGRFIDETVGMQFYVTSILEILSIFIYFK